MPAAVEAFSFLQREECALFYFSLYSAILEDLVTIEPIFESSSSRAFSVERGQLAADMRLLQQRLIHPPSAVRRWL